MSILDQARALFRKFHGREPRKSDIKDIALTDTVVVIGTLDAVVYTPIGGDDTYIHEFGGKTAKGRPVLLVSHDGRQIYILAGGYRFTERGFIG